MSKESDVAPPPTSGEGLRRRRGRDFDEVDARIAIPVAAGRQMLQTGISKYRSLSGRALVVPGAALNAPPPAPDEPPFPRSTTHPRPRKPRDEPPEPSALERAQRLVAQKQFAAAIPYFSEALSSTNLNSTNAALQHQSRLRIYFERGACYLAAQRYHQAIEDFSRVIGLTPKNPQLFAKRARAYAHLQQHAAALADYNEAIALAAEPEPLNSTALRALLLARARVFAAMKDSRSALADLARAEAAGGQRDAELFYERAHVHLARGEQRLALQDLDRFLELQADELAHQDVVDMPGVGAADEALERALDVRFDRAKLLQKLAAAEDAQHRADAELLEIEQGVLRAASGSIGAVESAKGPKKVGRGAATTAAGTGYQSAEAIALVLRAIKDYSALLDVEPATMNVAEILRRRGIAFGSIGRFEDALHDLSRAHELSPSDFDVRIARARLYQQQRDLPRAIAEMTAVLQLNGFFLDALFFRAKLYVETGDLGKAQKDYTSIIEAHYDVRSESYSDAAGSAASATATEKTPLLSKANGSSSSSIHSKTATSKGSSQAAASTSTAAKPARFLSEYSKKALLLRARLWVQMNKFEEAIADYEQLKLASANEIDAQMELQDVLEKQAAFVEKERLAAEQSLLKDEEQERMEAEAKKSGNTSAAAAAKKKKKKKAKKKKRPTPSESGYVLLPDEEDDHAVAVVPVAPAPEVDDTTGGDDDDGEAIEVVVLNSHQERSRDKAAAKEEKENVTQTATASAAAEAAEAEQTPARAAASGGAVAMTREEAFESLWEEEEDDDDDPADADDMAPSGESVASGSSSSAVVDAGVARGEQLTLATTISSKRDELEEDDEAGAASDDRVGDGSGDESATSSGGGGGGGAANGGGVTATREVIVDEKYLRKRQRQLEKLRSDIRRARASRDRAAIEEMLERAERKQMADALGDEIERAKSVLDKLASGAAVADDDEDDGDGGEEGSTKDLVAIEQQAGRTLASLPAAATPQASAVEDAVTTVPAAALASDVGVGAESPAASASPHSSAAPLARKRSLRSTLVATSAADPEQTALETTSSSSSPSPSSKPPPSLVIRPIAYGQALQLAEQSQHQFLQYQRLLQEKDAEIASLRQLLAQCKRQAAIERLDAAESAAELAARVAALRSQFPHKQLRELEHRVETLVNWMGPSDEADHARHKVLAFVYRVLEAANIALGTPLLVFPTGSFPMKTYLPTADLDVCLLLPKELEQSWHFPVMHALCLAGSANAVGQPQADGGGSLNGSPSTKLGGGVSVVGSGGAGSASAAAASLNGFPSNTVRNVNFINADVRVIKCTVDNISVDFTANRIGALGALLLLDSMDARVGKHHLLKKSLILIKAWCIHESGAYTASSVGGTAAAAPAAHTAGAASVGAPPPAGHSVMGSSYGAFSTYAVNTAVMGLFNQYGAKITHPLQALFLFLDRMAEFPWHEAAMTLHGPVALSALASASSLSSVLKKKRTNGRKGDVSELHSAKISFEDVEHIRLRTQEQFGGFDASAAASSNGFKAGGAMFQIRVCNIVDPLDEKNNLARSVSVDWFPSMKRAFRLGRNRLAELLASPPDLKSGSGNAKRVDEIDDFFVNSWRAYGRGDGWRPDLLVHPRQVWHGKPSAAAPSDPNDEELRWQSLLPELVVPMAAGPYQPQPQGAMYYQLPYAGHHHQHHHQFLHQMGGGSPHSAGGGGSGGGALGLAEPMPYQQPMYHRRSFDGNSKSSPLKSLPSIRHHQQQLSPGPVSGAGMNYGISSGGGGNGMAKAARGRYESPPHQGPVR